MAGIEPFPPLVRITIGRVSTVKEIHVLADDAPQFVVDYLRRSDVVCVRCEGQEYAGPMASDYRPVVTL